MDPVNVIYFTKEDGQNKLLLGSHASIDCIAEVNDDEKRIFEKILGHKPSNIYALIDGTEFEIIPRKVSYEDFLKD